jgi:signal transduction histidine kinase
LSVSNADRHKHKPEFVEDAISTIANATQRISRLMEQLRDQDGGKTLQACNLTALILEVVSRCGDRQPVPVLVESPASTATIRADFERLANALEHVIRNAQEASSRSDQISVRWSESDGMAEIVVTDTGAGMTPEFIRTRLFKPFDSTKGSKGMGIGAYQVREYVRSLDGEVEVQSSPGSGTAFHIRLPRMIRVCRSSSNGPSTNWRCCRPEVARKPSASCDATNRPWYCRTWDCRLIPMA